MAAGACYLLYYHGDAQIGVELTPGNKLTLKLTTDSPIITVSAP